jgi:cysteine desulfurase
MTYGKAMQIYRIPERMDPRVFEAMQPYLTVRFGNAASLNHSFGWEAQDACDRAREQVAAAIHAQAAREIIFTSGGMESALLAIEGGAAAYADRGDHIVAGILPSSAAARACQDLQARGCRITLLPFDRHGQLPPEEVEAAVTDRTVLITAAAVHEVLGVCQPVAELSRIARAAEAVLHIDGGSFLDLLPVDVQAQGIDLLSVDGPALYGPRGTGALYVRGRKPRVLLTPLIDGGGQERGWRSGTLNVPGIVGLGAACALAAAERAGVSSRLLQWQNDWEKAMASRCDGLTVFEAPVPRMPGVVVMTVEGVDHETLAAGLAEAMQAGVFRPARILPIPAVIGRPYGMEGGLSIRFNRFTTEADLGHLADALLERVKKLRGSADHGGLSG